jgi:hypothetical protein
MKADEFISKRVCVAYKIDKENQIRATTFVIISV